MSRRIWTLVNIYIYIYSLYSDNLSYIYSDILSGIQSDVYSDFLSGILFGILSDILSGIRSGTLSGLWLIASAQALSSLGTHWGISVIL